MTNERQELRNLAIALRASGYSWNALAREMDGEVSRSTLRRWADPEFAERQREQSRNWKKRTRGTCKGCGAETRYSGHTPSRVSEWCRSCSSLRRAKWSRAAIINAIRTWAKEHGGAPPGALDWNPALARARGNHMLAQIYAQDDRWPATSVVQRYFGSWNEAIRQSGFEPRKPGQRGKTRR